jgi:hypothetical protein
LGKAIGTLTDDLKSKKNSLSEFVDLTKRVLNYYQDVVNDQTVFGDYILPSSTIANQKKQLRPINTKLFIRSEPDFQEKSEAFKQILEQLKIGNFKDKKDEIDIINSVVYTIQQSVGLGMDLTISSNSARKLVGNRFEELIKTIFSGIGIANKKVVLTIPYQTDSGIKKYRCETDLVISPYDKVRSDMNNIDAAEVILSVKTTTKDRMGKIFIDKILIEKFVKHPVKIVGISQNDVQRKEDTKVASTFVSNLFMVYTQFLTKLDGYYYFDLPEIAKKPPYNEHINTVGDFLTKDLWSILRA